MVVVLLPMVPAMIMSVISVTTMKMTGHADYGSCSDCEGLRKRLPADV